MDWIYKLIIAVLVAYGAWVLIQQVILLRETWNMPRDPRAGPEALEGKVAVVSSEFQLDEGTKYRVGAIRLAGETWRARCTDSAPSLHVGSKVKVVSRDGLTLVVERHDPA